MHNKRIRMSRRRNNRNAFLSTREDDLLLESAKNASSKAVRSSRALGITIKVIRGDKIIAIDPDNTETILRTITKSKIDISSLKKGMILERKAYV